jgi:hypothetical protein
MSSSTTAPSPKVTAKAATEKTDDGEGRGIYVEKKERNAKKLQALSRSDGLS